MQRRIFYAASPWDVLIGFLSLLFFGALIGLMVYAMCCHSSGGLGWPLLKVLPFAAAALSTMLYRERVVAEPRFKTVDITCSFFLIPFSRIRASFGDVRAVRWISRPSGRGVQLVMELNTGKQYLLSRAAQPDRALSADVRSYFGLEQTFAHDVPPPPPPAPVTKPINKTRVAGISLAGLGIIVAVCSLTFLPDVSVLAGSLFAMMAGGALILWGNARAR